MTSEQKQSILNFLAALRDSLFNAASTGVPFQITRAVEELPVPSADGEFARVEPGFTLFVVRVGEVDLERVPVKDPLIGGYRQKVMQDRGLTPRRETLEEVVKPEAIGDGHADGPETRA